MKFKLEELVLATGAKVLKDNQKNKEFSISTDTRTIKNDDIYLPLKGETFDGENFIENALKSGAVAYFTSNGKIIDGADVILKVDNTTDAYLNIAKFYKKRINPITVAITGSSGKTTTKEMVYSVLSQKYKTHKTLSNHNNEIGFCQTLLSMPSDTEALVVEMGMRGFGEIELLTTRLEPDFAIVTNCGSAHIGRLGSLDNIAKAKCEIALGLSKNGVFIAKNQDITKKHLKFNGETIYYSLEDAKILEIKPSYSKFEYKKYTYELNVEGEYNIENSLGIIELGQKLGISNEQIAKGLFEYKPIEKRWDIQNIGNYNFINDSYNANPDSMRAAVKTFVEIYDKPVVILGDMGELGKDENKYHEQVGEYLSKLNKNVKYLFVGNLAKEIAKPLTEKGFDVALFENNEQVARYIIENLNNSYTIFLKASRFMKFEEILEYIKKGI